ncbi:hypothetical protein SK128_010516 [Halocaridina rubra]|uniref:C3H1-type domain-containing protein n=1 Tax=Halocaridina rubra TaxID=373956 RepID=A0AAN8WVX0_HALRR
MATTAANAATDKPKSKRTPIVLNMHLLYADNEKKPNKDVKDSKDLKVEKDADKNTLKVGESKMAESSKDVANAKGIAKKENGMEKDEKEAAAGGRGQSEKVCRDFMRSMCNRGDKCKFYHPPQENPGAGGKRRSSWLVLCHDFQNGQCTRSDCSIHLFMFEKSTEIRFWHTQLTDKITDRSSIFTFGYDFFFPALSCL